MPVLAIMPRYSAELSRLSSLVVRADKELEARKKDAKRQRVAREKNLPAVVQDINAMNDPDSTHRRFKLSMPQPQINDDELADVAKLCKSNADKGDNSVETATSTLLADYSTVLAQPERSSMRTPTPNHDVVLAEAQNLLSLTHGQTPLVGEENATLNPSDFSGITPAPRIEMTPNPIAASEGSIGGSVRGRMPGMTPDRTPLRDELRINSEDVVDGHLQDNLLRSQVVSGLTSLPAPRNEYQIQVPNLGEEIFDLDEPMLEEDTAHRKKRASMEKRTATDANLRLMSHVLQRGLPRPNHKKSRQENLTSANKSVLTQAADMVAAELTALLVYEAAVYPIKGKNTRMAKVAPRQDFDREALESSELLVLEERMEGSRHAKAETYLRVWSQLVGRLLYLDRKSGCSAVPHGSAILPNLQSQFQTLQGLWASAARKSGKTLSKGELLTRGLTERVQAVIESTETVAAQSNDLVPLQVLDRLMIVFLSLISWLADSQFGRFFGYAQQRDGRYACTGCTC